MNLNTVMRLAYLLGWAFAILAVAYKGLVILNVTAGTRFPVSPRSMLLLSGLLFVMTIATAAYAKAQGAPAK